MDLVEDIRRRFGRAVRRRREQIGLSQEEFAEVCDVHRTYMGGIERGERNVSLVNIEKIANGLKISLSALFHQV
jgi:transcriptional regulator with XRE-family HTH domain